MIAESAATTKSDGSVAGVCGLPLLASEATKLLTIARSATGVRPVARTVSPTTEHWTDEYPISESLRETMLGSAPSGTGSGPSATEVVWLSVSRLSGSRTGSGGGSGSNVAVLPSGRGGEGCDMSMGRGRCAARSTFERPVALSIPSSPMAHCTSE